MARKTKAQFLVEATAQQQLDEEMFEASRDFKFLQLVALAHRYANVCLQGGWGDPYTFTFTEAKDADDASYFTLVLSAPSCYAREYNSFDLKVNSRCTLQEFEDVMQSLKYEVSYMEAYVEEAKRKASVRSSALAKLSKEERELLGV